MYKRAPLEALTIINLWQTPHPSPTPNALSNYISLMSLSFGKILFNVVFSIVVAHFYTNVRHFIRNNPIIEHMFLFQKILVENNYKTNFQHFDLTL